MKSVYHFSEEELKDMSNTYEKRKMHPLLKAAIIAVIVIIAIVIWRWMGHFGLNVALYGDEYAWEHLMDFWK